MASVTRVKPGVKRRLAVKVPSLKTPSVKAVSSRAARWPKPVPPDEVTEIFRRFAEANPHPHTELHSKNPFTLLVAVVLSAQATDAGVNKATPALFAKADSPEKMLALGEDNVRELIKTIGLYRAKAKNVIGLSRALVEGFAGKVPRTREELESLPGVGRKTANVVLERRLRPADDRRRYAYLPRLEPDSAGARQERCARSRTGSRRSSPKPISSTRIIG